MGTVGTAAKVVLFTLFMAPTIRLSYVIMILVLQLFCPDCEFDVGCSEKKEGDARAYDGRSHANVHV